MSDNLLRIGQIHFELLVNIDITGIKHWQATQQSLSSSYVKSCAKQQIPYVTHVQIAFYYPGETAKLSGFYPCLNYI